MSKNEYASQIWQNNIRNMNIIPVKDWIILKKASKKEKLSKNIANTTTLVKSA